MKTQDELLRELDQLKAEERWDEALKLLDLIEPVSDEEWRRRLDAAPLDDEPVPALLWAELDEFHGLLRRQAGQRAG